MRGGLPEPGGQLGADNGAGRFRSHPASAGWLAWLARRRPAAGVGFEPTVGCPTAVFKTAALGRWATPPRLRGPSGPPAGPHHRAPDSGPYSLVAGTGPAPPVASRRVRPPPRSGRRGHRYRAREPTTVGTPWPETCTPTTSGSPAWSSPPCTTASRWTRSPSTGPGTCPRSPRPLDGLVTRRGHRPAPRHGDRATDVLAPHVMSSDASNFLSFIPAAPTKASLLFDMVVSASSLQGISWLEAAGAVPPRTRRCGSIADLGRAARRGRWVLRVRRLGRQPVRARRGPRHRAPSPGRARRCAGASPTPAIAVSDQAHSSVTNTLSIIDVDPFVVTTADHRFTGEALRAALDADTGPGHRSWRSSRPRAPPTPGSSTTCRRRATVARERGCGSTSTGPTAARGLFAPSVRDRYDGIERADSFVVDPHKWLFAPFDCAALLYREPRLAKAVHTQDASLPRRDPRRRPTSGTRPTSPTT